MPVYSSLHIHYKSFGIELSSIVAPCTGCVQNKTHHVMELKTFHSTRSLSVYTLNTSMYIVDWVYLTVERLQYTKICINIDRIILDDREAHPYSSWRHWWVGNAPGQVKGMSGYSTPPRRGKKARKSPTSVHGRKQVAHNLTVRKTICGVPTKRTPRYGRLQRKVWA